MGTDKIKQYQKLTGIRGRKKEKKNNEAIKIGVADKSYGLSSLIEFKRNITVAGSAKHSLTCC